jgi:alkylated DNA repair dioxygenase AlkB
MRRTKSKDPGAEQFGMHRDESNTLETVISLSFTFSSVVVAD